MVTYVPTGGNAMCTAITYRTRNFYFGRTLDYHISHGEEITLTPRQFPLPFKSLRPLSTHYAILGVACVNREYPLYFDGINEKGLAMAGLNFIGYAHYLSPRPGKENVAHFEFIPWVLGQCASVKEARTRIAHINLTNLPFHPEVPPAQLHWIIADRNEAITVECTKNGISVHPNPAGVLTNNPPFDIQLFQLNNYQHLSTKEPQNRFAPDLSLHPYSRGMGALGLPGDLSSQSRFVRAAFVRLNSVSGDSEEESVSQFFHILGTVQQPRGCCDLGDGAFEITRYTSCCNADKGIYYYTTYDNPRICAVDMHREDLDADALIRYPLLQHMDIYFQNHSALSGR